jgi:hypothetical protein
MHNKRTTCLAMATALLLAGGAARADEWHGMLDIRASAADGERSWTRAGLGKSRYDADSPRWSVGQAVLQGQWDLSDSLSAVANLSASDQHAGVVDVREAWIGWNPVPTSAWKWRAKAGSFFPPSSVEIDYGGLAWTPTRTISSSAINSWIGEELRTNGVELQLSHNGRFERSPHDYGMTAALFVGNDPAGTLLAWRGWSISDRIAGRNEAVLLPDLPVYRADGDIPRQDRTIHPFREVDGRLGYYVGANYRYQERMEVAWLHYDNRADPLVVKNGQYGWHTRFNHLSLVLRPQGSWELLFQAMRGDTLMGANAVALDFQAWYALVSRQVGPGKLALRYDRFRTSEHDILPADPNAERGHAVALAYSLALGDSVAWVTELLQVDSMRDARPLIQADRNQRERSLVTSVRWQF